MPAGRREKIKIVGVQPGSIPYTLLVFADIDEGVCGTERSALNVTRDLERQVSCVCVYVCQMIDVRVCMYAACLMSVRVCMSGLMFVRVCMSGWIVVVVV